MRDLKGRYLLQGSLDSPGERREEGLPGQWGRTARTKTRHGPAMRWAGTACQEPGLCSSTFQHQQHLGGGKARWGKLQWKRTKGKTRHNYMVCYFWSSFHFAKKLHTLLLLQAAVIFSFSTFLILLAILCFMSTLQTHLFIFPIYQSLVLLWHWQGKICRHLLLEQQIILVKAITLRHTTPSFFRAMNQR